MLAFALAALLAYSDAYSARSRMPSRTTSTDFSRARFPPPLRSCTAKTYSSTSFDTHACTRSPQSAKLVCSADNTNHAHHAHHAHSDSAALRRHLESSLHKPAVHPPWEHPSKHGNTRAKWQLALPSPLNDAEIQHILRQADARGGWAAKREDRHLKRTE